MLTAGEKNELITIKRDTITRAADGSEIRTAATWKTRMASVLPLGGREFFEAQQTQSSVQYRVRLDLLSTIRQSDYIVWRTRTLQIVAVMHDEPGFVTTLICAEINA